MKFKFKGTHPTFFENKIIFILKSLGGKIAISDGYIYLKWSEKVSPIMIVIADHEIFKIWSWVIVDHSLARWSWVIVDHKKKYRPLLCLLEIRVLTSADFNMYPTRILIINATLDDVGTNYLVDFLLTY